MPVCWCRRRAAGRKVSSISTSVSRPRSSSPASQSSSSFRRRKASSATTGSNSFMAVRRRRRATRIWCRASGRRALASTPALPAHWRRAEAAMAWNAWRVVMPGSSLTLAGLIASAVVWPPSTR